MNAQCARHPAVEAAHACRRCGNFACAQCLAGSPLCVACRELALGKARIPSSLPGVALALSLVGLLIFPFLFVGVILGIVSLTQRKGSLALGIAATVVPAAAIPIIGILAAIAIPNFIKFGARSKQAECRALLKAAITAEKDYFSEHDAYETDPQKIGFAPEKGNRYLYDFGGGSFGADTARHPKPSNAELAAGIPADLRASLGLHGTCPNCSVTIACAGNLDEDPVIDVWSVSTRDRPNAAAGVPVIEVDDTRD
jgi:type II secretory pathway pseudopilin PulG